MVLTHFQKTAAQCDQANKRFGLPHCCNGSGIKPATPLDNKCNNGGFPEFGKYGYRSDSTIKTPLSWDQVKQQIFCRNQPFVFSWEWNSGGGHMMVAVEYQTDGTSPVVCRFDPDNNSADSPYACMLYNDYDKGSDYRHWNDYYDFAKIN